MEKKLAIKGHPTRGKEVIALLQMLGGCNGSNLLGTEPYYVYFITDSGVIGCRDTDHILTDYFTLEEFLEKFPFKVGDYVFAGHWSYAVDIRQMRWNPNTQEVEYMVKPGTSELWYTANKLTRHSTPKFNIGETVYNKHTRKFGEIVKYQWQKDEYVYLLHDLMNDVWYTERQLTKDVESLYENELKTMFKEHDIVTVVAKGGRSRWICEYKNAKADQLSYYKGTYVVTVGDDYKEDLMYDSSYDISPTDTIRPATPGEVTLFERIVRKIEKPNILAELLDHLKTTSKEDLEKEFDEIKEWSNVGPTVEEFRAFCESVNRKPKYPTTYGECCDVLGIGSYFEPEIRNATTEECRIFTKLIRIKRCRDAYWKIAGEEMALDGPWEPDWNDLNRKYFISLTCDGISLYDDFRNPQVLAFPTAEMRDAFYGNFKDLIEQCKELL